MELFRWISGIFYGIMLTAACAGLCFALYHQVKDAARISEPAFSGIPALILGASLFILQLLGVFRSISALSDCGAERAWARSFWKKALSDLKTNGFFSWKWTAVFLILTVVLTASVLMMKGRLRQVPHYPQGLFCVLSCIASGCGIYASFYYSEQRPSGLLFLLWQIIILLASGNLLLESIRYSLILGIRGLLYVVQKIFTGILAGFVAGIALPDLFPSKNWYFLFQLAAIGICSAGAVVSGNLDDGAFLYRDREGRFHRGWKEDIQEESSDDDTPEE